MPIDPVVLALTLHGHTFFALPPEHARALAERVLALAGPEDDEVDLIYLYALTWRANRDARLIEEDTRHLPVHHEVLVNLDHLELPERPPLGHRYDALVRLQDLRDDGAYTAHWPAWRTEARREAEHPHEHHAPPPTQPPLDDHHHHHAGGVS